LAALARAATAEMRMTLYYVAMTALGWCCEPASWCTCLSQCKAASATAPVSS
jgi:hypothetical protein